jgi:hypothetical protein
MRLRFAAAAAAAAAAADLEHFQRRCAALDTSHRHYAIHVAFDCRVQRSAARPI